MKRLFLNPLGACLVIVLLISVACPVQAASALLHPESAPQTQVDEPLAEALALFEARRYQEAVPKLEAAADLFRRTANAEGEADALFWLGATHIELFQYDQAQEAYAKALAVEQESGRRREQAIVLDSMGLVALRQGLYEDALAAYKAARDLTSLHDDPEVTMATLLGLQYIYQVTGQAESEEARAVFSEMAELPELKAPSSGIGEADPRLAWYLQAEVLTRLWAPSPPPSADQPAPRAPLPVLPPLPPPTSPLSAPVSPFGKPSEPQISVEQRALGPGGVYSGVPGERFDGQARPGPTLEELQANLDNARAHSDLAGEARSLINIASMYQMQGGYEQALDHYQQALPILEALGDQQEQITILSDIGYIYDKQDRYQEALTYYQRALALAQQVGDHLKEGTIRNNMGLLDKNLGRYQEALDQYEQALAIWQAADARIEEGYTRNNLGGLYAALQRYDEALAQYEAALQIERQFGDGQREGRIISNIGAVYVSLGRYDEALAYFQEALDSAREIGDLRGEETKTTNIGTVYGEMELYEKAIARHQEALAMAQKLGNRVAEGINLYGIGFWNEVQGNSAQAIDYYRQSIDVFESVQGELKIEELTAGFAGTQAARYARLIRLLAEEGDAIDAFNYAERARARAFLDQIGNQRVDFQRSTAPELVEHEQALRQQIIGLQNARNVELAKPIDQQRQALLDTLSSDLERDRKDHQALLTRLKLESPEYASLVSVNTLTLEEVQKQVLDEHTTLIEYFVMDDRTLAWVVDREGFELVSLDVTRDDLRNQVEFLRKLIARRDFGQRTASSLYDTLFAPLEPLIRRANPSSASLVIVPHDVLHYLPFAALWNDDSQRFLVQDYAITYAPSASVLKFIQNKRNPDQGRALVLGNPDGTLPNAAAEAEAIAGLYGTAPLLGREASESQVYAQAGQVDVLHLAAHGVYDPYNPLFTRVELAADDAQDGNLEVHEVFGLDLTAANLVVLSACETALGEQSAGDELVGLTRAFLYAGAPAVVTTLWSIDDEATGVLMTSFYRHLRAGLTNADALRAAQLEVLGQEQWQTPYYWAAFNLTGDYRGSGEPGMVRQQISEPIAGTTPGETPTSTSTEQTQSTPGDRLCGSAALLLGAAVLAIILRMHTKPEDPAS